VTNSGGADRLSRCQCCAGHPASPPRQVLPLKRSGPEPLYYQLAVVFENAVESGAITRGTRLLPEKDMAEELNLAVSTVRQAWAHLERKGILTRTRKTGTFVR
jgi:DNA-binding GntR family transcriptional regulator